MPRHQAGHYCTDWQSHVAAIYVVVPKAALYPSPAVSRLLRGSLQTRLHFREAAGCQHCMQSASKQQALQSTQASTAPSIRYQEAVLRLNSAASSPDGSLARQQVATILHPTHSQNLHCTPPYLRSPPSSVTFCSEGIWKMKASLGACMQNKQEAGSAGASWSLHIACCTGWQRRIFCSCRRWRREWTAMSAQAENLISFSQQAAFVLVLVIGTSRGACAHHSLEELHFAPGLLHQLGSHVEVAF